MKIKISKNSEGFIADPVCEPGADCALLDDYDRLHLRVVNEEAGMNLRNL